MCQVINLVLLNPLHQKWDRILGGWLKKEKRYRFWATSAGDDLTYKFSCFIKNLFIMRILGIAVKYFYIFRKFDPALTHLH